MCVYYIYYMEEKNWKREPSPLSFFDGMLISSQVWLHDCPSMLPAWPNHIHHMLLLMMKDRLIFPLD